MNCHACGAPLAATARFCHKCGAQVGGAQSSGWRAGLPWSVAGAALGALLTVVALRLGAGSREPGVGDAPEATAPRSQLPAPDISQMSPEERATRLYNRVMLLHTQGKADSAEFFLPMALQAYAMLPALDVDARYHIGVLDLTSGDAAGALAQADTIRRAVPTHLFGFMLRARALDLSATPSGCAGRTPTSSRTRRPSVRASGPSTASTRRISMRSTSRRRRRPPRRRRVVVKAQHTIHLAHSPDADDAFMFWALAAGRIDTGDRRYVHELGDIESLNRRALAGELEVTAVSLHAYAYLADRYALLAHGASIGDRYGPRIVARAARPTDPRAARDVVVPFDQIEDYVAAGRADAGLLIHEGQLTYADRGLHLWVDLGEWWYDETGLPLPLGGNVVRRDLGDALMRDIAGDLKASIQYGLAHRAEALAHATAYSRGLDQTRIDRFVGMYVNAYTVDYGPTGRRAVAELLARAHGAGLLPGPVKVTFVAG